MEIAALFIGSLFAGAIFGCFYGFCIAGHHAILQGQEFESRNPVIRLLSIRGDRPISVGQAIGFLVLMALSLALFISTISAPVVLGAWLAQEGFPIIVAYLALLGGVALAWPVGKALWWRAT